MSWGKYFSLKGVGDYNRVEGITLCHFKQFLLNATYVFPICDHEGSMSLAVGIILRSHVFIFELIDPELYARQPKKKSR